MWILKFVLVVALCFAQLYEINAAIKVWQKSIAIPEDSKIILEHQTLRYPNLTYLLCDTKKYWISYKFNCKLVRENILSPNDTHSCDVTLKLGKNPSEWWTPKRCPAYKIGAVPVGKDNVVLHIVEEYREPYAKFMNVRLNDCLVKEYKMQVHSRFGGTLGTFYGEHVFRVVAYDNFYEVYYWHPNIIDRHLRLAFDLENKIIDGPTNISRTIAWLDGTRDSSLHAFIPISTSSRDKGLLYLGHGLVPYDVNPPRMFILQANGSNTYLNTLKIIGYYGMGSIHRPQLPSLSMAHNFIGLCLTDHDVGGIKCNQFAVNGTLKFETAFIGFGNNSISFATYNLPSGGLLVAGTHLCENGNRWNSEDYRWFILKVDSTGNFVGKIDINESEIALFDDSIIKASFFENENNEYCLSYSSNVEQKPVKVVTNCFADADFLPYSYPKDCSICELIF